MSNFTTGNLGKLSTALKPVDGEVREAIVRLVQSVYGADTELDGESVGKLDGLSEALDEWKELQVAPLPVGKARSSPSKLRGFTRSCVSYASVPAGLLQR